MHTHTPAMHTHQPSLLPRRLSLLAALFLLLACAPGSPSSILAPSVQAAPWIPSSPNLLPDVSITQTNMGNNVFQPGQIITYSLTVSNSTLGGPISSSQFVKVKDVLPTGLINVTAVGTNWSITASSPISPVLIAATYRGLYPLLPGSVLPPIIVTGTILSVNPSTITCTAVVGVSGDSSPDNNMANNTIFLSPLPLSPSPSSSSIGGNTATVGDTDHPVSLSLETRETNLRHPTYR